MIAGARLLMNRYVLDASAVLALLNQEPGMEQVEPILGESIMSTVNMTEVLSKLIDGGMSIDEATDSFDLLGIESIDLTRELAQEAASLRGITRKMGLSLGDRCCLALGVRSGLEVVTAERDWKRLKVCPITLIR
jgi:ribonuclease VapC